MNNDQNRPKIGRFAKIRILILSLALIGLSSYFAVQFIESKNRENEEVDRVRARVEQSVFLGPILENEPDAKKAIRKAILSNVGIDEDENAKRALALAVGLNRQYAAPALRAADDVNILNVWLTRTETALWLSDKNAEACAVFIRNGSIWPADLGKDFLEIYQRHLDAQKTAYIDGFGKQPRALLDEATFSTLLLGYLGLSEADIAVLEDPSSKPPEHICVVGVAIATGLANIPEQHQVPFVRQFLTMPKPF